MSRSGARRRRPGVTLLELMVGFALFGGLLTLVVQNLRFGKLASNVVEKLDVLQQLRIAELLLRNELEVGTAVLWPREGDPDRDSLVFAGPTNRLAVLYLDGEGRLKLRREGEDAPRVLASGIVDLTVRQPLRNQVECTVVARSEEAGEVSALISGYLANQFQGAGHRP